MKCKIDGCSRKTPRYKRGMCIHHYNRWYKETNPGWWRRYSREQSPSQRAAAVERVRRWREENPERFRRLNREKELRRRARLRGAPCENIEALVVLEMHDGVCGICGEDIDPEDFHIDHIVPLSKGGSHTYDNVQPAHPRCNLVKHARMPDEAVVA